jgi:mannose-6-phosphate isomerase-like protein (cupin superfamily)
VHGGTLRRRPRPDTQRGWAGGRQAQVVVGAQVDSRSAAGRFEWYQLTLQPGGTLDSQPHEPGSREHLTVHSGTLEVQAGAESARVRHGETARYTVDVPHRIHNPGKTIAQALLVVLHPV